MKIKKLAPLALVGAAVVFVVLVVLVLSEGGEPATDNKTADKTARLDKTYRTNKTHRTNKTEKRALKARGAGDGEAAANRGGETVAEAAEADTPTLSPAEQKIADDMQSALDDENFKGVKAQVEKALASGNLELLKQAVEAAKWFGPKSLSELTAIAAAASGYLADKAGRGNKTNKTRGTSHTGRAGGETAVEGAAQKAGAEAAVEGDAQEAGAEAAEELEQLALDAISEKLAEIENDGEKAALIQAYMKATSDENILTTLSGELKTILDEQLVVKTALDLIENGSAAAKAAALEVYEFETGDAYTTSEAAQNWLAEKAAEAAEEE